MAVLHLFGLLRLLIYFVDILGYQPD